MLKCLYFQGVLNKYKKNMVKIIPSVIDYLKRTFLKNNIIFEYVNV